MTDGIRISTLWWQKNPDDIVLAPYDANVILYHRPSGMTHMLNSASVVLLTEMLSEPASLDDIAVAFSETNAELPAEQLKSQLAEMLMRLEHFGIIERVAAESA